ncbi:RDD family protein [Kaistia dalseonensis]|uniref:RDD family membrane protein YckC n=1 Tax=Kaistia dalseonensis TaxID=410840 RepID=A0ABU0H231_9HYPH|nr:RDD family protein [Kaistia dalseonensis]MCX5493807.1 RDD family protein [Kaistia dalseonensis]MDQ0436372.1 putative RDD family membrane protein YckC [Kaistia dalseonensis]
MTQYDVSYSAYGAAFDPFREPELFSGVLSKRVLAFIVDAILVGLFLLLASVVIFALGVVTLGIGWFLFALPLFAIVAVLYVALTLGGPNAGTPGMRLAGLQIRSMSGERIGFIIAAAHALLFWFSLSFLTPLVLIVGLFSNRKRLLHDILLGTVIMNADPLIRTRR